MDLTDQQWLLIHPFLPTLRSPGGRGRPPLDRRTLLNGILWKLRYRKPWRTVPAHYGSHQACYQHYNAWEKSGLLQRILDTLKDDLSTRGNFNFEKEILSGNIHIKHRKDRFDIFIQPECADDWRISTALIFYHQFMRDVEQRVREGQF